MRRVAMTAAVGMLVAWVAGMGPAWASDASVAPITGAETRTAPPADAGAENATALVLVRATVKYASIDRVFLTGGSALGLAVGDTLTVTRDGASIGRLIVADVASNTASCVRTAPDQQVRIGDLAEGWVRPPIAAIATARSSSPLPSGSSTDLAADRPDSTSTIDALAATAGGESPSGSLPAPETDGKQARSSRSSRPEPWARVRGGVSVQWQRIEDDDGVLAERPAMRLRLHATEMWGRPYFVRVRAAVRRIDRPSSFGEEERHEWDDRVTSLVVGYEPGIGGFGFQAGRVPYIAAGGVGHLDGAIFEYRPRDRLELGIFAGMLPDAARYLEGPSGAKEIQKYGFYVHGSRDVNANWLLDETLAASGWFDRGESFGRFVASSGRLQWSKGLLLSHAIELKQEATRLAAGGTNPWSMGSSRVTSRFSPDSWWSVELSQDWRASRLYPHPDLADTTTEVAGSSGTRLTGTLRPVRSLSLRMSASSRKSDVDPMSTRTISFGVSNRLPDRRTQLRGQAQYIDGPRSEGWSPSFSVERPVVSFLTLGVSGGARVYRYRDPDRERINRYARGTLAIEAPYRLHLRVDLESAWGDDPSRRLLYADLGYSF